uniref:Glucuronosyltransferase n=1 Tax=Rhabditophanes sp. KR3021 TaxID=114890 RepID=A0AC35TG87_9BILA
MRLLLILFGVVDFVFAAKILVFIPEFGESHQKHLAKIADFLSLYHDVTAIISPMDPEDANVAGIKLAKTIRRKENPSVGKEISEGRDDFKKMMWTNPSADPIGLFHITCMTKQIFSLHCQSLMDDEELTDWIKNEKFDLALAETFDSCHFGMYTLWGIKNHIALSSGYAFSPFYEAFGLTFPTSQTPSVFADFGSNGMGFKERLLNVYYEFVTDQFLGRPKRIEQALFDKKYGKNVINIDKNIGEAAYWITNAEPLLNFGQPVLSKILELGGFNIKPANALNKEWEDILHLRKNTILISFGSVAKAYLLPDKCKKNLKAVFKAMPETTFIFKYEKDDMIEEGVSNVMYINSWLPQVDLLNHPQLDGFVSHGGLNSLVESANFGKALVLIPLFGDQPRNAEAAKALGIGMPLSKFDLDNFDIVKHTFEEVFTKSDKYKLNALRIREVLRNQPINKTDLFLKHVDFAAKYGSQKMLQMIGTDQNFVQKNNLDIYGLLLVVVFSFVYLIFASLKYFCCRKNNVVAKAKKTN